MQYFVSEKLPYVLYPVHQSPMQALSINERYFRSRGNWAPPRPVVYSLSLHILIKGIELVVLSARGTIDVAERCKNPK